MRNPLSAKKIDTPKPANNVVLAVPSAYFPKTNESRPNSLSACVVCENNTAIAAIALNPLSPLKYIVCFKRNFLKV